MKELPYGENLGIAGKCRYMAPEVVMAKKRPDLHTDRFSLAVVLYLLLFLNHPLEGKKTMCPCLTEELERKFYGSEPVFVWDANDDTNRPVRGVHINEIKFWPLYPRFVHEAFGEAFCFDAMVGNNIQHRVTEKKWQEVFTALRDVTVMCRCGSSWKIAGNAAIQIEKCPFCGAGLARKAMESQWKALVQQDGIDVLKNGVKINGILADMFPKQEKERASIKMALHVGAGMMFYEIAQNRGTDCHSKLQAIQKELEQEAWLSGEASAYLCRVFLSAIGREDLIGMCKKGTGMADPKTHKLDPPKQGMGYGAAQKKQGLNRKQPKEGQGLQQRNSIEKQVQRQMQPEEEQSQRQMQPEEGQKQDLYQKEPQKEVSPSITLSFGEALFGTEKKLGLDLWDKCGACKGTGKRFLRGECLQCRGKGYLLKRKFLSITIPAGTENGQFIRIRGKGEPGTQKGERGDLLIEIKVVSQPIEYKMHIGKEKFTLKFEGMAKAPKNPELGLSGVIYVLNRKVYTDISSLGASTLEELSGRVMVLEDSYHNKVLYSYEDIPAFDFADRQWDTIHGEYLMFDGKHINLVVCGRGYRIGSLDIYKNLLEAEQGIKPYLEKLGYPAEKIEAISYH